MSEAYPIISSEVPDTKPSEREKITEIFFEKFHIPAYYLCNDLSYQLYHSGRSNGLVVDMGHHINTIGAFYDGVLLPKTVQISQVSGKRLSEFLLDVLRKKNIYEVRRIRFLPLIRNMKE